MSRLPDGEPWRCNRCGRLRWFEAHRLGRECREYPPMTRAAARHLPDCGGELYPVFSTLASSVKAAYLVGGYDAALAVAREELSRP